MHKLHSDVYIGGCRAPSCLPSEPQLIPSTFVSCCWFRTWSISAHGPKQENVPRCKHMSPLQGQPTSSDWFMQTQSPCLDRGHLLTGHLSSKHFYRIGRARCCDGSATQLLSAQSCVLSSLAGILPKSLPGNVLHSSPTSNSVFQEN